MDTANFLARVLASSGAYVNVSYNQGPGTEISRSRMFRRDDIGSAASYMHWLATKNNDVYHSQATFLLAHEEEKNGKKIFRGERKIINASHLKSFWIDIDVKRPGDKKTLANSYATQVDALQWLKLFRDTLQFPDPSIIVSSGYGLHVYWCLEDEMLLQDWLPYGRAMAKIIEAHGFTGDTGLSSDAVRLLRPPGTSNMKSGLPVEVRVLKTRNDVANATILGLLAPYLPAAGTPVNRAAMTTSTAVALSGGGGNVVSIFGTQAPNMAAAAAANIAPKQARFFAAMAAAGGCAQVAQSLAEHGEHDNRRVWYLGLLSAAVFCDDAQDFIHAFGDKHPAYTPAHTDAEFSRAVTEQAQKDTGWPQCSLFNAERPGPCSTCPHNGVVKSPLEVAIPKGSLPDGYRRHDNTIQWFRPGEKTYYWDTLVHGDIFEPVLYESKHEGSRLFFKHTYAGKSYNVFVVLNDLTPDTSAIYKMFERQHVHLIVGKEVEFRRFLLSYTKLLRDQHRICHEGLQPFGWIVEGTQHRGFALAGRLFRPDGREDAAPGGDPVILDNHQPQGDFAAWQDAAHFVIANRPDLQIIVAASFGAPLVRLMGHKGLIMSAWSVDSGAGKTSALTVAQGVWGSPGVSMGLDDTHNSVGHKLGQTHALPAFWDEMRIGDDTADQFVQFVFRMAQGKEKSRMGSNGSIRAPAEWETLMFACANSPLMDRVYKATQGTEAGALRVFEYQITHGSLLQDPGASGRVQQAAVNFGHAGVEYARYLAVNHDNLRVALNRELQQIILDTGAATSERMHTSAIAAVLIGAKAARKLGLVDFDVPAMRAHLYDTLNTLRIGRSSNLIGTKDGYDVEQALSMFMSEYSSRRVVTEAFVTGSAKAIIKWLPEDRRHVDIQISQQDRILRIDRTLLSEYVSKLKLSPSNFMKQLELKMGAIEQRAVIAAGTGWSVGRRKVVDIPIIGSDMEASYMHVPEAEGLYASKTRDALIRKD